MGRVGKLIVAVCVALAGVSAPKRVSAQEFIAFDLENLPPPDPESAASRCRDNRLIGLVSEAVTDEKEPLCGAREPVKISAIRLGDHRIEVTPPATLRCEMARRLARWTEEVADPATRIAYAKRLSKLHQVSSYSCRRIGGKPDGDLSQHGLANAIDLAAVSIEGGKRLRLEDGWDGAIREAGYWRMLWTGGCRIFGTTLGPEANAAHKDHFHFDAKRRRRSGFCE